MDKRSYRLHMQRINDLAALFVTLTLEGHH
jgi:hypothetical protein